MTRNYSKESVDTAMDTEKPPLYELHEENGASFTEFGGWSMPVDFGSIKEEHRAVRESHGLFDVSHMGEIKVEGSDAEELMQYVTTRDISDLDPGSSHYSAVTRSDGVMLDDIVIYRLGEEKFLFIPNAGHDGEMLERWSSNAEKRSLDVDVENVTRDLCMFALQGPDSKDVIREECSGEPSGLEKFSFEYMEIDDVMCLVSRTGYTGEDGYELIMPNGYAEEVWRSLGSNPCGLGARDTLRLEMGFLLSGQDFDPDENPRNPFEAGIGFVVDLENEFIGRDGLSRGEDGVDEKLTGFVLTERGVPRHGYEIKHQGDRVGFVTSGTMSPTLDEPIGMGYLPIDLRDEGTEIEIVIRGDSKKAKVSSTPFIEKA